MKPQVQMEGDKRAASDQNLAELLIDFSIDAIIAIDINHNIITWNSTAAAIYDHAKKKTLGKSLFEVIPDIEKDPETVKAIEQALKGYKTYIPALAAFAHRLHKENHFIPLQDNDGNVIGVMNVVHDVAHRIKAEQQLQHLNEELERRYRQLQSTAEELASFTYITSSKIKEPIRQVYTGIEHLIKVEAGRMTDSGKATFRRMQSSLNRMDLLLDDILSLAQISILQKPDTAIDLTELLKEVSTDIRTKSEKEAVILIDELCVVTGYKNYLYLLFYNLFENAIKFNDNAVPRIQVACKKVVLSEKINGLVDEPEYFKVTITDNGIGIDTADLNKVFIMFEKLHDKKYKGSGIGLTIAKKIMEAHNGFITVESSPAGGTSFHCFFPVPLADA